jgi:hypothetical protein
VDEAQDGRSFSPWTRPRFVMAAVIVLLIAVMGVVATVLGGGDDQAIGRDDTPRATASPSATPSARTDSGCGLPAGSQLVPTAPPPGTRWELVGTVAAPTAPRAHGPGVVRNGLRSCFAHSPTGALYAAANFLASSSNADLRVRVAEELTADGPGREAAVAAVKAGPNSGSDAGLQISGFNFLDYNRQSSTVDMAMRLNGSVVHLAMPMRWETGDWKVVMPPDGDLYSGLQALPDAVGYVPWAGA